MDAKARLLAVEVLLADPEQLGNDALKGDLYILRDTLIHQGAACPATVARNTSARPPPSQGTSGRRMAQPKVRLASCGACSRSRPSRPSPRTSTARLRVVRIWL